MKMKKLAALALAAVLTLGMATTAMAATITVTNPDPSSDENAAMETYTAYKIFDAVKAAGTDITTSGTTQTASGAITYKINATSNPWFGVLFNADGTAKSGNTWFTATAIPGASGEWQVNPVAAYTTEAAAKAAADWLLENKPEDETGVTLNVPTGEETEAETTVDDGYYLITSSLGTNLGLATTEIPMTLVEKNEFPSVGKTQTDAVDGTYSNTDVNVQVGDTVYYKVSVYVPETANGPLTLTDTMSAGLTAGSVDGITAKIGDVDLDKDGNWSAAAATAPATYTITVEANDTTKGETIDFYMTATVDADAITETARNNTVVLTYSNYTQTDSVAYTTFATGAVKYDGATAEAGNDGVLTAKEGKNISYLANAEFKLQVQVGDADPVDLAVVKEGSYYRPAMTGETGVTIVSDANGEVIIRGLDADKTYTLVETKAPAGFNLLVDPVTLVNTQDAKANVAITGTADDTTTVLAAASVVKIANNAGSVLPSTGGIGTTIFYVVGGILVLGAGVVLVTKKRMAR